MEASTKPYSKSGLRARSWLWRKAALRTLRKYAMWTVCDAGRWSRVTVSRAIVRDERRVLQIWDWVCLGDCFDVGDAENYDRGETTMAGTVAISTCVQSTLYCCMGSPTIVAGTIHKSEY